MKPAGIYILEVIICSGLLLTFYQLLLARRIPYRACRRFLLGSALAAVAIPLLRLPILPAQTVYLQIPVAGAGAAGAEAAGFSPAAAAPAPAGAAAAFPWQGVLLAAYAAVVLLLLALLVRSLLRIEHLRKTSRLTPLPEYTLAEHARIRSPFSFWRTIFLRQEERPDGAQRAMIVAHEAAHIRHRHSRDKVALGVLKALFWFNPFFWMMERLLSEVQEYEADEDVLRAGYNIDSYRLAIFKQLFGYYPDLTSGLSHSLTKKRFTMMNQAPRGSLSWLRLTAALPLFAGLLVAFGATARTISSDPQGPDQAQSVQNDPNTISILVSANDSKNVTVDGQTVAIADLAAYIQNLGFDAPVTANLQADPNVKLGVVEDVKQQLRQTRALKLNYRLPGQAETLSRHLSPAATTPDGPTVVSPSDALKDMPKDNVAAIRINSAGRILLTYGKREAFVDDIVEPAKDFIRKHAPKYAFTVKVDNGAPYASFIKMESLVDQAISGLRDEKARSTFGKPFADLSAEEAREIQLAIPLNLLEIDSEK